MSLKMFRVPDKLRFIASMKPYARDLRNAWTYVVMLIVEKMMNATHGR